MDRKRIAKKLVQLAKDLLGFRVDRVVEKAVGAAEDEVGVLLDIEELDNSGRLFVRSGDALSLRDKDEIENIILDMARQVEEVVFD